MRWGALLHDIGKIGVSDAILNKPGALAEEAMEVMQRHPVRAKELLESVEFLGLAIEIPCGHHERWDGSGYPHGFTGTRIPLSARIFVAMDAWDALVSDRPCRKAWAKRDAVAYIEDNAGKLFDPEVVRAFSANVHPFLRQYGETDSESIR